MTHSLFDPDPYLQPIPKWEQAELTEFQIAQVVVNRPLDEPFDYLLPESLSPHLKAGMRVRIPFGRGDKLLIGYCVGIRHATSDDVHRRSRLKQVAEVLDTQPLMDEKMLELTRWIAERYLAGWGQVIEGVVPAGVKKNSGTRELTYYQLDEAHQQWTPEQLAKLPAKQRQLITILMQHDDWLTGVDLTSLADCGPGPIKTLLKKGWLTTQRQRQLKARDAQTYQRTPNLTLNPDQQRCLSSIVNAVHNRQHVTFLLHGATGSGKTEVYIQAIQAVTAVGKQAIVLVPEISLTPQTIRRFRSRFDEVAVLHSHLSDSERHHEWQRIFAGEVQVVVGARSAIFAPLPRLGLIIIDEEHETTFKQDSTPRYHARDVADRRAQVEQIPLVLGSATPSLEACYRAKHGHYQLLKMPKRIDGLILPRVDLVDTLNDPLINKHRHLIGRTMEQGIKHALEHDGQVILFFNLRGFTPVLWCPACREKLKCPHCDLSLTWHKDKGQLLCHTCNHATRPPEKCPYCHEGTLKHLGAGTQKLEEEVRSKFPAYRALRMDSDSMRQHGSHDEALELFRHGHVQILLGTQMISKGLDFPNVTFVGVIDTDSMLFQPDFRATERTFQLISQVAGRTGRSQKGGRVYVQTTSPDEPAIALAALHDFNGFVRQELIHRAEQMMPPSTSLARVICRGMDEHATLDYATLLAEALRKHLHLIVHDNELLPGEINPIRILGPCPPSIARMKQYFRFHLQITAPCVELIHRLWHASKADFPKPIGGIEHQIDIDAMSMR